jgi:hypothetical protein
MKTLRVVCIVLAFAIASPLFSCGGGGGGGSGALGSLVSCNALTDDGCDENLSCEFTDGGETGCFLPVVLSGNVFNLATGAAVEGARVVAMDANGSVASNVAVTDAEGNYQLAVSVLRDTDGNPASGESVTLRADAQSYQTFPGGVRQALPVDVTGATEADVTLSKADALLLDTSLTDIGLIALEAGAPTASIYGTVEMPDTVRGTLVVAEFSQTKGYSAIADLEGNCRIFNLPAGNYTVQGYTQGSNYGPATAPLADGEELEKNLSLSDDETAILSGSVQIVNAPGGSATSVILVVESTFNEALTRGEMPPGLRAPDPGTAPDITGAFTIEGIPAGTYVILAAFENDILVRDPDTCISGTDIIHQIFAAGQTVDLSEGFKITEALEVLSPGAGEPEAVSTATPTFSWVDDSSEDQYDITLLDTFGNEVWAKTIAGSSGADPSVVYDGPALETGMYYQFKVVSSKSGCELSQTEDLKGVFYIE